jgi:hypothetical protein
MCYYDSGIFFALLKSWREIDDRRHCDVPAISALEADFSHFLRPHDGVPRQHAWIG